MNTQLHTLMYTETVLVSTERQFERFNELASLAQVLREVCQNGEKIYPGYTNIIGDVWFAFYSLNPELDHAKRDRRNTQYSLLAKLMQTDEFARWHTLTAADDLLSVLTAVSVGERLRDLLAHNNGIREAQLKKKRAERSEEKAREQLVLAEKQNSQNTSEQEKKRAKLQMQFIQKQMMYAQQDKEQAEKVIEDALRGITGQMLQGILAETKQEAKQTKQAVLEIGTMDGKKSEHLPMSEQFQLIEQIQKHDTLKKIAEMTGRFKRIAKKRMKTKQNMTMERKEVTLGQEVARLLPTEAANLIMPDSKLDFLRRYAEQQTFVFDTKGKNRKGRGPIIICMDESSSMTGIKEESKAFCLALLMIARRQKRDFAIIPFASDIGEILIFPKGRSTSKEIISFSEQFLGGGTNYEKPLRASLDILGKSEFNEADILFVTDGSSFLPSRFIEGFNAVKKKRKFECTSIVLTNLINTVDMELVNSFSDKVIEVNELFEAEDAFYLN
jgi:uncharacterized protein with von Willebrand factor type A (vWA) domain